MQLMVRFQVEDIYIYIYIIRIPSTWMIVLIIEVHPCFQGACKKSWASANCVGLYRYPNSEDHYYFKDLQGVIRCHPESSGKSTNSYSSGSRFFSEDADLKGENMCALNASRRQRAESRRHWRIRIRPQMWKNIVKDATCNADTLIKWWFPSNTP